MVNRGRKLEEITFENGGWIKVNDRTSVTPHPLGNLIPDVRLNGLKNHKYDVARRGAREQGLWGKVNAYSAVVIQGRRDIPGYEVVVAQLYVI